MALSKIIAEKLNSRRTIFGSMTSCEFPLENIIFILYIVSGKKDMSNVNLLCRGYWIIHNISRHFIISYLLATKDIKITIISE